MLTAWGKKKRKKKILFITGTERPIEVLSAFLRSEKNVITIASSHLPTAQRKDMLNEENFG